MIGHKFGTPISPFRRMLVKRAGQLTGRLLIFFSGVTRITVERPKIDYSEYLGSSWKPTYEGETTLVYNHTSWIVLNSTLILLGYICSYVVVLACICFKGRGQEIPLGRSHCLGNIILVH